MTEIESLPTGHTMTIAELITILRVARNTCRDRRHACLETSHPAYELYSIIADDIDTIIYRLSRYAYAKVR